MPVVTPSTASIDSQNAVPNRDVFIGEISGRCSASQRSGASARQISPRPCVAMKLIASGVINSRRHGQIAFVLAVLVIDDDQHSARAKILERFGNRGKRHYISG